MIIEQVLPNVIGGKASLPDRLRAVGLDRGLSADQIFGMMRHLPQSLMNAGCFLDRLTGFWRYEFGIPHDLEKTVVFGADMWIPVTDLFTSLSSAQARLPAKTLNIFLRRLSNIDSHKDALIEMIPASRAHDSTPMEFEVIGAGAGHRTIDWIARPSGGRSVLLDVKNRIADFLQQIEIIRSGSADLEPTHDPAILFRSVEGKFNPADSDIQLQGVWVVTNLKQNKVRLHDAFDKLAHDKVHFAIFGDWESDLYVMTRRADDRKYLLDTFRASQSERFTFTPGELPNSSVT